MGDLATKQRTRPGNHLQLLRRLGRAAEALEIDPVSHDNTFADRESLYELRAVERRVCEPEWRNSSEGRIALPDSPQFPAPKRESKPIVPRVEGHWDFMLGQPNRQL